MLALRLVRVREKHRKISVFEKLSNIILRSGAKYLCSIVFKFFYDTSIYETKTFGVGTLPVWLYIYSLTQLVTR